MVPYHRPIPERRSRDGKGGSGGSVFNAWVQAEKLMQIAILLPSAAIVGWLLGAWADKALHQSWIGLAGMVFGGISGLVYVVRLVMSTSTDPPSKSDSGKESAGRND